MDTSRNSVLQSFAAGAASGTVSSVLLQPLDMVKTRVQTCPSVPLHTHCRTIYWREGGLAFWKGLGPTLVRTVPGVGLYFSCLNYLQYLICGSRTPSSLEFMLLGGMSRTIAATVLMPATVLKIRFESGLYRYTGLIQALGHLGRHEGLRGLTAGIVPTLLRDVPFSSVYIFFYSSFKSMYLNRINSQRTPTTPNSLPPSPSQPPPLTSSASVIQSPPSTTTITTTSSPPPVPSASNAPLPHASATSQLPGTTGIPTQQPAVAGASSNHRPAAAAGGQKASDLSNFLCGLCAGVLACSITQPFDVVKTKMQVKVGRRQSVALIREIWQGRGLAGFFSGLTPRLVRRTLMASMSWTLYEKMMRRQKPARK